MPNTNLQFHSLGQFPYPYVTTGANTAMTMVAFEGEHFLAFLTQTAFSDQLVYLHPESGHEMRSVSSAGIQLITGMAYDDQLDGIWVCEGFSISGVTPPQTIKLLDHDAQIVNEIPQPVERCYGIATLGNQLIVSGISTVSTENEFFYIDKSTGAVTQTLTIPDGHFSYGLSSFLDYLIAIDTEAHKVYILRPNGSVQGIFQNAPGTPETFPNAFAHGLQAIAADNLRDLALSPQLLECSEGADSQAWQDGLCDPNLPWQPQPWGTRHRIYIANETDQIIHVGYFTP